MIIDTLRQLEETLRKMIEFDHAHWPESKKYLDAAGINYVTDLLTLHAMIQYLLRDEAKK
jgi:hypothetical protein